MNNIINNITNEKIIIFILALIMLIFLLFNDNFLEHINDSDIINLAGIYNDQKNGNFSATSLSVLDTLKTDTLNTGAIKCDKVEITKGPGNVVGRKSSPIKASGGGELYLLNKNGVRVKGNVNIDGNFIFNGKDFTRCIAQTWFKPGMMAPVF